MNCNLSRLLKKMSKREQKWQQTRDSLMKTFKKKYKIKKGWKMKKWMQSMRNFFQLRSRKILSNKGKCKKKKIKKVSLPYN